MVVSTGRKQHVAWQDVRPVQTRPKPTSQTQKKTLKYRILTLVRPVTLTYKKTSTRLSRLPRKGLLIGLSAATLLLVIVVVALRFYFVPTAESIAKTTSSKATNSTATKLVSGTPEYATILPTGKTIEDYGGWTRVSPPDRNPVFAYIDTVGGSPVTISQQPLPVDFQSDTDEQIQLLAQGYKANEKVTVGDTTVYIGTSAKGPQSVIFNKNNLLVLIKSTVAIKSDQWAQYINSLQ